MIDFGFDKIALIGAVALIVIGPEKLPKVARTVGHLFGKAQRYVADVKAEVNRSIELEELKKMKTQFEDAARNVEDTVRSKSTRPAARSNPTGRTQRRPGNSSVPHDHEFSGDPLPLPPPSYQQPQEELAPQARCHTAVVQAAAGRAHQGAIRRGARRTLQAAGSAGWRDE
jgi:sec-independent protein translocase protein TatB